MSNIDNAAEKLLEAANKLAEVSKKLDQLADEKDDEGSGSEGEGKKKGRKSKGADVKDDPNTAAEKLARNTESAFEQWTGINSQTRTFAGQIFQVAGAQGIGALKEGLKKSADNISKMLTPANLFANLMDKIVEKTIEFAIEQDRVFSNFEKQVGNVSLYADQITNITTATAKFGTTLDDTGKVLGEFKMSFAGFENLSKSQQTTLATTSVQLTKLGIASADLARNLEFLVKAQGQTVEEANNLQKSLYATANAMGIPPARMISDFGKAAPALAAYGKNMTKVFLDLQNSAKNTGISFDNLLKVTSRFNTFDAAAESAGQLNAILGGDYLNSIALLNANEGERVKILQESLKMSNRNIKDMSIQEQQAMAQAIGLSDVTELQKLMNNETSKRSVETIKAQKAQEQMNEVTKQAIQLSDKISALMTKLAINLRPVIEYIKESVDFWIEWSEATGRLYDRFKQWLASFDTIKAAMQWLSEAYDSLKKKIESILPPIGSTSRDFGIFAKGVVGIIVVLGTLKLILGAISGAMTGAGSGVARMGRSIAQAVNSIGRAATKNVIGILALGAAMFLVGVGIGIAAIGMSTFVSSFAALTPEQVSGVVDAIFYLTLAFVAFTAIMAALIYSGIGPAAAGIMLALGVSAVMFGYAISLASEGMEKFIDALAGGVIKVVESVGDSLTTLFTSIKELGAGHVIALGGAFVVLAGGLAVLGVTSVASLFSTSIPEMILELKEAMEGFKVETLNKISDGIITISVAMNRDLSTSNFLKSLEKLSSQNLLEKVKQLHKLISVDLKNAFQDLENVMLNFSITLESSFLGQFIMNMNMFLNGIREMADLFKSLQEVFVVEKTVNKVEVKSKTETPKPEPTRPVQVEVVKQIIEENKAKRPSDMPDFMERGKPPQVDVKVLLDGKEIARKLSINVKGVINQTGMTQLPE